MQRTLLVLGVILSASPARAGELLVFAATSTTEAMKELGARYEAKTGTPVIFSFAGSSELARQLVAGAPAEVFLSADQAQMDRVEKAGRVRAADRRVLVENALVLVQRPGAPPLRTPVDLEQVKVLALADPKAVPAGVYARTFLTHLGLWPALEPRVVPTLDVRAALAAVRAGRADAAFVYATDARLAPALPVVPNDVLAGWGGGGAPGLRAEYPLAPLVRPDDRAARAFVDFLRGPEGAQVLRDHGFQPPGAALRK